MFRLEAKIGDPRLDDETWGLLRRPEAWWGDPRFDEEAWGLMRRPDAWWGGLKLMRRPEAWWGGLWLDEEAWSLMRRPKAWGGALGLRSEKETVGLRRKRSNVGGLREKIEVWGGGGLWGGGSLRHEEETWVLRRRRETRWEAWGQFDMKIFLSNYLLRLKSERSIKQYAICMAVGRHNKVVPKALGCFTFKSITVRLKKAKLYFSAQEL